MHKIGIVGSRNFTNEFKFKTLLQSALKEEGIEWTMISEVVSGGAIGTDRMARNWARAHDYKITEFLPEWGKHGSTHEDAKVRNRKIVEWSDIIFAFWDGSSPGTAMTIQIAKAMGKKVVVIKLPLGY